MPGVNDTSTQDARSIVTAVLQLGRRLRAQRPAASVTLSQLAVLATLQRLGPMPGRGSPRTSGCSRNRSPGCWPSSRPRV